MDLIASGLAVASIVAMPRPSQMSSPKMEETVQATANQEKNLSANAEQKKIVKHPLRVLSSISNLGMASWYGSVLHGHKTASGEVFDKDKMTACHRTLPFGTLVRVVDVTSGKSVVVKINDRGVLNPDRIIDLSSAAAEDLGILRAGVAKVRLEILSKVLPSGKAARPTEQSVMNEVAEKVDAPAAPSL